MKDLKASKKDKKMEEELNAPKIFSGHEFFIPEGLGSRVEVEMHEYFNGDPMNEETRTKEENVRVTFFDDLGALDLTLSIPKSVFQQLLSLGSKFSKPVLNAKRKKDTEHERSECQVSI